MKDDVLKNIPQDDHCRIILLDSILNPNGFTLEKSRNGRIKIVPIPGKEYFNPFTKERMSESEAYSLYE